MGDTRGDTRSLDYDSHSSKVLRANPGNLSTLDSSAKTAACLLLKGCKGCNNILPRVPPPDLEFFVGLMKLYVVLSSFFHRLRVTLGDGWYLNDIFSGFGPTTT